LKILFTKIIKILLNYFKSFLRIFYKFQYDHVKFEKSQIDKFDSLGLDYKGGLEKLKKYLDVRDVTLSHHSILFSSISLKRDNLSILEIGTHNAKNVQLLSQLYPKSKIITIDLDEDDEKFENFYNRSDFQKKNNFCKLRDEILNKLTNAKFLNLNSVKLKQLDSKFDLIWIDGAHCYPEVAIDIMNSLNIINVNGMVICDDVYKKKFPLDEEMYISLATFQTLEILKKNNIIDYSLIHKRINVQYNSFPFDQKYIAIVKKL